MLGMRKRAQLDATSVSTLNLTQPRKLFIMTDMHALRLRNDTLIRAIQAREEALKEWRELWEDAAASRDSWNERFVHLMHDMKGTLAALDKVTQERDMAKEETAMLRAKTLGYMMRLGIAPRIAEQQLDEDREVLANAWKADPYSEE